MAISKIHLTIGSQTTMFYNLQNPYEAVLEKKRPHNSGCGLY